MVEVILIFPDGSIGEARVVVTILGAFYSVHIEKDLNVVFLGHVKEPCDLVVGTFCASDIGSIGLQSPVTDWDSDNLDLTSGHVLEGIFCNPSVPMLSENLVSFIGTKGLTESVLVHTNTFIVGLAEEAVEERRSDPGLEHLPATDVSANHGSLTGLLLSKDS